MKGLSAQPNSSTPAQRKVLVLEGRKRGMSVDDLRAMYGGSLRSLSAAAASAAIRQISEKPLPNPPGQKPRAYAPPDAGVTRMIQAQHIEQIERLGLAYFDGEAESYRKWLRKYHGVDDPRQLLTAARAGEVIRVLKEMDVRKHSQPNKEVSHAHVDSPF